jgi:protein MpaA
MTGAPAAASTVDTVRDVLVRSFPAAIALLALAACEGSGGGSAGGASDGGGSVSTGDTGAGDTAGDPAATEPIFAPVSDGSTDTAGAAPATASIASTTSPSTTTGTITTTTTSTTSTTSTSTTSTTTLPVIPDAVGPIDLGAEVVGLGRSTGGLPIIAERYGDPGGRRVLVIGVIHGDEDDGVAIVDELRDREVPGGVELWLVESMNPDGREAQDRHNGNEVDLNRNFPYKWGPIGVPGDPQYAGTGPASEPETQAMVNFIAQLQPDIAIWYHQDLYVINPSSGREGAVRQRYAELTGLPMGQITGGTYTGIAATWARDELTSHDGVAFIVELGPTLSPAEADAHATAVLTLATDPL